MDNENEDIQNNLDQPPQEPQNGTNSDINPEGPGAATSAANEEDQMEPEEDDDIYLVGDLYDEYEDETWVPAEIAHLIPEARRRGVSLKRLYTVLLSHRIRYLRVKAQVLHELHSLVMEVSNMLLSENARMRQTMDFYAQELELQERINNELRRGNQIMRDMIASGLDRQIIASVGTSNNDEMGASTPPQTGQSANGEQQSAASDQAQDPNGDVEERDE